MREARNALAVVPLPACCHAKPRLTSQLARGRHGKNGKTKAVSDWDEEEEEEEEEEGEEEDV